MLTFTIEVTDEPTDQYQGDTVTRVYIAKLQHWPEPGESRIPNQYGTGVGQEDAAREALGWAMIEHRENQALRRVLS